MFDIVKDEIGRCFCKAHRREECHECCMSFDITNRMAEEEAGLIKKRTPWEVAAEEKAIAYVALQGMERMHPRPSEAVFAQNQKFLKDADKKLQKFARQGHDVETAFRKALESQQGSMLEMDALAQAWKKENPNSNHFEVGGPETQRLYEQFTAAPKSSDRRGAVYTCDHCKKSSTVKLLVCSRCKKVAYCSKECQKTAWKAHKKTCIPWTKESEPKNLALSWDELEAFGGRPAEGKILEVRAMLDESMSRQVFQCKDRVGKVRRIAAYNNSRRIPGLQQGSIIKWKNPRFHYFMDGSSGARIEEDDLVNVTVK